MSQHRYPPQSLIGDDVRAGLCLVIPLLVLSWFDLGTPVAIAFVLIAALGLGFVARMVNRHREVVALDDDAITLTGFRKSVIRWEDLARVNLAYYAVKKDKSDAWMEITLKDAKSTIKLDSRLENFGAIVVKTARVARERRIPLNQITLANLKALNITGE